MMILQEPRDYSMTLKEQKIRLDSEYINFQYLYCFRSLIIFAAEGRKEKR